MRYPLHYTCPDLLWFCIFFHQGVLYICWMNTFCHYGCTSGIHHPYTCFYTKMYWREIWCAMWPTPGWRWLVWSPVHPWSATSHSLSVYLCCLVTVSTGCSVGCDFALLSCVFTAVLIPRLYWLFAFATAFLVVALKVCAHSRTSSTSRLVYESVIPYLLLVSAINLEIVLLYCFTSGEILLRLC